MEWPISSLYVRRLHREQIGGVLSAVFVRFRQDSHVSGTACTQVLSWSGGREAHLEASGVASAVYAYSKKKQSGLPPLGRGRSTQLPNAKEKWLRGKASHIMFGLEEPK